MYDIKAFFDICGPEVTFKATMRLGEAVHFFEKDELLRGSEKHLLKSAQREILRQRLVQYMAACGDLETIV